MNIIQKIFFRRRGAYKRTFNLDDSDNRIVMADLRKFCRATGDKYMGDYEKTLIMIGRNQVWERMNSYVHISDSEIATLVERVDE